MLIDFSNINKAFINYYYYYYYYYYVTCNARIAVYFRRLVSMNIDKNTEQKRCLKSGK